jgi:hypothetical protein
MKLLPCALFGLAYAFVCTAAGAQTGQEARTIEELKRQLAAKDAHIRQLEGRIRKIEKTPQGDIVGPPSAPRAAQGVADRSAVSRAVEAPAHDDDELDRALERTLVREGALVLPPWVSELTPQFSYAHWDKVQNPYVRNSYTAALGYRLGLPWGFQVSAGLPYTYSEFRDGTSNSGLGDAGFLLSKELFLESSWTPNLVGSVGWTSPTSTGSGNTTTPIPYVSGFQAGLTASKRLDPLVVFGSVSYFSSAARDIAGTRVDPSDVLATRFGGSIALSPASSVTAGFNLAYLTSTTAADFIVPNSDRVLSSVDIGYTTILWKRTLLNVTGQFGLTGNVPDFRLITSIPVRF